MHYVSGHEVAGQIISEVLRLAYSPTIAWQQAPHNHGAKARTYYCQVGDLIATKIVDHIDVDPPNISLYCRKYFCLFIRLSLYVFVILLLY